jgi:coenzyme F420-reducing hydrogenase alpha subunit
LQNLADQIEESLPLARKTLQFVADFAYPLLESESRYVALRAEKEFAVNTGRVVCSSGLDLEPAEYGDAFIEEQRDYAMAKPSFTRDGESFMVGALARMNLKFDQYHSETRKAARETGVSVPDRNPFHNNLAQALEIHHCMLECIELLTDLHPAEEPRKVTVAAGEGTAVTEAPRGLLMHHYAVSRKGFIERANIVTPTSHNFANIEKDLQLLVRQNHDRSLDDLRALCEQLVRAYDPCFSCSVH